MYSREKIVEVMQAIYDESRVIQPYVMIAQPRRDLKEQAAQNFDGYDGLHVDLMGFSHGFCNIGGEKVDVARNYLCERALESGAKYMFFVGEDTVVPYDAFKRLMRTSEANPNAIVTGVYYIKCSDAMIMCREGDWITVPDVSPGQLIEAWQTGMDCMLIPIEILRRMKDTFPGIPFCCVGSNINDEIPFIGDDNFFVHLVHKMGVKLLVDTNVQCLHMDLASGMYTAHPSVDLKNYYTNIKPTRPLTLDDKEFIDRRWIDRLPAGTGGVVGIISKLVEEGKPVKFNMGSGQDRFEGYIAVDKYNDAADIKEDLADLRLPDECADEIYASHVLEHISYVEHPDLLRNWCKALKPTGQLVLQLPDLGALCAAFAEADDVKRFELTLCIFGAAANKKVTKPEEGDLSPHVWGYYPKILQALLLEVGFSKAEVVPHIGVHPGHNFRIEATK